MDSKTIVELFGAKIKGQQLLFDDFDFILKNTGYKKISPELDKEIIVHWFMNIYSHDDDYSTRKTDYEVYVQWSKAISENFKYVSVSGYLPETGQSCVKLACHKNEDVNLQLNELQMWLPHIKPIKKDDKLIKYVRIFESSLSRHAAYALHICETEVFINKNSYGRQTNQKFDDIATAVNFIHQNIWYKDGNDD